MITLTENVWNGFTFTSFRPRIIQELKSTKSIINSLKLFHSKVPFQPI